MIKKAFKATANTLAECTILINGLKDHTNICCLVSPKRIKHNHFTVYIIDNQIKIIVTLSVDSFKWSKYIKNYNFDSNS